MSDRLLCRGCGAKVPVPEARFVGPAILCAECERALGPCPESGCSGLLMEIPAGPDSGGWQCVDCRWTCGPGEVPSSNVIEFPSRGVAGP